jgi:hypothetical protein
MKSGPAETRVIITRSQRSVTRRHNPEDHNMIRTEYLPNINQIPYRLSQLDCHSDQRFNDVCVVFEHVGLTM